ncbi:aldo-keto reductase family 1, member C14, isoform CRA_a [Mus musculus]|nr:aldo-keto reductase family 1, member C14, isoform CRA_a [Mus musculus]
MNSVSPRVVLNDGHFIPALGFGTTVPDKVPKDELIKATKIAIDTGFRHFDSAYFYQLQRGIVVLTRSFKEKRIKEFMKVFEFQLASEDMKVLDGLHRNLRYNTASYFDDHPNHPFTDEY